MCICRRSRRDQASAVTSPALRRQIVWSRLIACVEEQARTLMKVAFSPTVREAGDLSAGLFDRLGRMIAQAVTGTPGHVNAMAIAARHFLAEYPAATMCPGDHYITNDPWLVSGHLHDVTVLTPVFRGDRLIAFFACTCHQVDIGGLGMGPDGRSIFEEGMQIPVLPLARSGEINRELMRIIRANVRTPTEVEGDILAYVTANDVSARRLNAVLDEFSLTDIDELADHIIAISEAGMRAAITALPDGTWCNTVRLDGYDAPVDLVAALTIAGDTIVIDLDGSSPASPYGINLVLNYTTAYASYGVRAAIAPDVPNNAGSLAPIAVRAPVGCILNVERPAPVSARHIIGQFLPELVLGCLGEVLPDLIPANGAACNWGLQIRGHAAGRDFHALFFNAGGAGARPSGDGLSATTFPSGIRSIPVEICETVAPVLFHRREMLPDTGRRRNLARGIVAAHRDGHDRRQSVRAVRRVRPRAEPGAGSQWRWAWCARSGRPALGRAASREGLAADSGRRRRASGYTRRRRLWAAGGARSGAHPSGLARGLHHHSVSDILVLRRWSR